MSERFFTVPGKPIAKGRPRFANGRTFTDSKTRLAESCILDAYLRAYPDAEPLTGPVHVSVLARFEVPRSWSKRKQEAAILGHHTSRPDLDNIGKTVLDALNGVAFADDSQVCSLSAAKEYWDRSATEVTITPL